MALQARPIVVLMALYSCHARSSDKARERRLGDIEAHGHRKGYDTKTELIDGPVDVTVNINRVPSREPRPEPEPTDVLFHLTENYRRLIRDLTW